MSRKVTVTLTQAEAERLWGAASRVSLMLHHGLERHEHATLVRAALKLDAQIQAVKGRVKP
jgi:hypothetical protein